jgi:hypothetical protein
MSRNSHIDRKVKNQIKPLKTVFKLITVLENDHSLKLVGSTNENTKIKIMADTKVIVDFSNLATN